MLKPAVLFLCTGNSARSQMAEAFLRKHAGDRFDAYSAGTEPKGLHPLTVQVMNEAGIDMSSHTAKGVKTYLGRLAVRYLIIVCDAAQGTCPTIWPGALNRLYWPFDDPAAAEGNEEERLHKFREVRDHIEAKIKSWLKEIS